MTNLLNELEEENNPVSKTSTILFESENSCPPDKGNLAEKWGKYLNSLEGQMVINN